MCGRCDSTLTGTPMTTVILSAPPYTTPISRWSHRSHSRSSFQGCNGKKNIVSLHISRICNFFIFNHLDLFFRKMFTNFVLGIWERSFWHSIYYRGTSVPHSPTPLSVFLIDGYLGVGKHPVASKTISSKIEIV